MSRDADETAEFEDAFAVSESKLALRVRFADGRAVWIPKSVVHDDSEVWRAGDSGRLVVAEWFAVKEGLV